MYEGNRNTTGNGGAIIFPSLPTTPASVAWSGGPAIISPGSLQSPSLVIQSVPEPSSVAMIALGILAGVSILRRSQIRRATLN